MNGIETSDQSDKSGQKTVLVVGATGFLGSKIFENLSQEKNLTVRGMSRKDSSRSAGSNVQWVKADMLSPESLEHALKGVDVVVASANGYMKESIAADFLGNRNLIDAASKAKVKRFVFLSVVNCEAAHGVPHFRAKKEAEDALKASGIPYVIIRAPAFLDQSDDYIAAGVKAGKFHAVGDKKTKWSWIVTDDLANYLAKAAVYQGDDINLNTIDVGWRDGAKSQAEIAGLVSAVTHTKLSIWVVPWIVLQGLVYPIKIFSELGYDMLTMFLFFKKGTFVSDISKQERFFGQAPSSEEAVTRWAKNKNLIGRS